MKGGLMILLDCCLMPTTMGEHHHEQDVSLQWNLN